MRKPASKTSARPLTFLFFCFVASGVLRLVSGQVAQATEAQVNAAQSEVAQQGDASTICPATAEIGPALAAIRHRQAELDRREAALADRFQALDIAESKLKENTAALVDAENRLADTLSIADTAAEDDLKRLTAVYENMKAKNAAHLFATMAPEFAAGFLGRMRPDSAALIMSSLDPKKAYAISLILAGRNANAPAQ